jgi:hypothetical protein
MTVGLRTVPTRLAKQGGWAKSSQYIDLGRYSVIQIICFTLLRAGIAWLKDQDKVLKGMPFFKLPVPYAQADTNSLDPT